LDESGRKHSSAGSQSRAGPACSGRPWPPVPRRCHGCRGAYVHLSSSSCALPTSHGQPERILGAKKLWFSGLLSFSSSLQAAIAGGAAQSWAFFTLDTLLSTPSGVTSPTTVTFFAAKSMLNDVTPVCIHRRAPVWIGYYHQNQKRVSCVILLSFNSEQKFQILKKYSSCQAHLPSWRGASSLSRRMLCSAGIP